MNSIISQDSKYNFRILVALLCLSSLLTYGQVEPHTLPQKNHKIARDILLATIPALVLSTTYDGQKGKRAYQFSKALVGTIAVTYDLKIVINKEYPNGENNYSFPSRSTGVALASAAFAQKRYGWKYDIPAYVLARYVRFTWIETKKHDSVDTIGAEIGIGISHLVYQTI